MKLQLKSALCVVMVSLFAQLAIAGPVEYYVSKDGNDANPGTKEKPVATLTAARDLIRRYKSIQKYPEDGFVVWVAEGDYNQQEPFLLQDIDSGTPESPIVWRVIEGDKVSLTGGVTLPSDKFTSVPRSVKSRLTKEAASKVKCIDLKALGVLDYGTHKQTGHALPITIAPMELFIDGAPMTLARYPNKGYVPIGKVIDKGSVPRNGDYSERGATFEYTDARHAIWAKSKDVWFQGTFGNGYADDKILVEKIDTKQKRVKLAFPHMYGVNSGRAYNHYVVLNVLDELDEVGEWYIDRESGMLYVWPMGDLKDSKAMVSILEEPIVCLEGASHVVFRDFTVEVCRGIGLYVEKGSNNLIAGCTIRNTGNTGVSFGQGAEQTVPYITHDEYEGVPKSRIIGNYSGHIYMYTTWDRHAGTNHKLLSCDIYNTGSGGVILGGGQKRTLTPGNNVVENCKVHDYNRQNKFRWGGIIVDGCGNRVIHNEIYNSDFQAIFAQGPNHLYEYNNIHHVTLHADDVSAWYMGRDPSDRGTVIRYNYFHHCGSPKNMNMGVYCDDSTTGVLVFGNVFYKMNVNRGVLYSNTGWDLRMVNNIVIYPLSYTAEISQHYYTWHKKGAVSTFEKGGIFDHRMREVLDITKPPYSEQFPELVSYMNPVIDGQKWEGMTARGNVLSTNVIVGSRTTKPVKVGAGSKEGNIFVDINNMMVKDDPGFVDFKGENFMLKPDSKVFKELKGFEPIPFDKMGLFVDEYRKSIK